VEPKESQNTNREVRKYIQKLFPLLVSFLCDLLLQTFMPWYSRFRERCRKWNRNIHEICRICVTFSGGITGTDGNVNMPYLFPGHVQFVCNFLFVAPSSSLSATVTRFDVDKMENRRCATSSGDLTGTDENVIA
jgi:hypothetical protein